MSVQQRGQLLLLLHVRAVHHQRVGAIWVGLVRRLGFQVQVHAIGDRAAAANLQGKLTRGRTVSRGFDSFLWAFVTVFQVLSLENWNTVLYDAMRSDRGYTSALFFVVWILIGNFVLLNIFLAVLLDSFSEESTPKYLGTRGLTNGSTGIQSYLTRMSHRPHQNPVPTGYPEL